MPPQTKRTLATGASLLGVVLGVLMIALSLVSVSAAPTATPTSGVSPLADGTTIGSPSAKVKMIVYFDPLCSHCLNLYYNVEGELITRYVETGKMRLEARPLSFLGPESLSATRALLAAAEQNRFWEYQAAMWDAYRRGGVPAYADANLKVLAVRVGLNEAQFNAAFVGPNTAAQAKALTDGARAEAVNSVPLTIIGAQRISGDQPLAEFVRAIEQELAK